MKVNILELSGGSYIIAQYRLNISAVGDVWEKSNTDCRFRMFTFLCTEGDLFDSAQDVT